jgi:hypothetical protein
MTDITIEKKRADIAQEADSQIVDHGAIEQFQTFQFSPEAERQLVWKIDLMSVVLEVSDNKFEEGLC